MEEIVTVDHETHVSNSPDTPEKRTSRYDLRMVTRRRPARFARLVLMLALTGAGVIATGGYLLTQGSQQDVPDDDRDGPTSEPAPFTGLEDDFGTAPLGSEITPYLTENWQATVSSVTMDRVSVLEEDDDRFIRVTYPEGEVGATRSGASWRAHFALAEEATAEYRFRFEPGFDWTEGGKLPGLTGGDSPTGGEASVEGFSARYMWKPEGGLIVYLYHSEQPDPYGQSLDLGQHLAAGEWHTLKQQVVLNTPGQADGILRVWVNGQLALDKSDMRWRLDGETWSIDSFYFSTFHGGSDDTYRPARTNHIDFDDVSVEVGTKSAR